MLRDPHLKEGKKVLVALSGGIDSSYAALRLFKNGLKPIGVYLKMFSEHGNLAEILPLKKQEENINRAKKVADYLGIPFKVIDVSSEFEKEIIEYFVSTYLSGKTPNPCVFCNPQVKFSSLLKAADEMGVELVATGHYARIEFSYDGEARLLKAYDETKDQSYYLYRLTQEQLKRIIFPNADTIKKELKEKSFEIFPGINFLSESQEVCFISGNYRDFISKIAPEALKPGKIVSKDGNVLGTHKGIAFYTVGQRKGLGISVGKPLYVIEIRPDKYEVVVGEKEDLYPEAIEISDLNFIRKPDSSEFECSVKVRYRMKETKCEVKLTQENSAVIKFLEKCPFPAPGQSAVLYNEDEVIGGGVIERWL